MRMVRSIVGLIAAGSLLLAGCGSTGGDASSSSSSVPSADTGSGYPLTISNCGHELTFDKAPERTVSLNQSSTEILLSLGLVDSMVGTATWTDPVLPQLEADNAKVERLADNAPSMEAVLATSPDFVTASFPNSLSDKNAGSFEKYESFGIPAYLAPNQCDKSVANGDSAPTSPYTFDKVYQEITELAQIFGVGDKGEELVNSLKERFAAATAEKHEGLTTVFWFANSEAPYVAGGSGASQFVADNMGITNLYEDEPDEWPQVSWEDIAAKNPDFIVLGDLTRKSQTAETGEAKVAYLESNPVTAQMEAVKNHRFIFVAGGDMNPSIRNADLAEKIQAGLNELDVK